MTCNNEQHEDDFTITIHVSESRDPEFEITLDCINQTCTEQKHGRSDTSCEGENTFADTTGSKECLKIAKSWLSRCIDNHIGTCRVLPLDSSSSLPTRLIETCGETIYLQEIGTYHQDLCYLILSYCWGKGQEGEIMLIQENRLQLLTSIARVQFPWTIINAFTATETLGCRYLWVDRLCVIQNSKNDWRYEAERMQTYYMMADCCIAALASEDAYQGVY